MELIITFALGLFILAGALIGKLTDRHHIVEQLSIAIAFGTMVTMALTDLLPEAQEHLEEVANAPLIIAGCVVVGVIALKVLDHFIPDHDAEELMSEHHCSEANVAHIGIITTIAVTLHNLIEGMAVFSVASESLHSGLMVALGVGLHNIPMGMIIYSTLAHESRGKKAGFLAAAAVSTFLGGLCMAGLWFAIDEAMIGVLISLTLGMICYIVFFELLPHLFHARHKGLSVAGVAVGVAIVLIGSLFGAH